MREPRACGPHLRNHGRVPVFSVRLAWLSFFAVLTHVRPFEEGTAPFARHCIFVPPFLFFPYICGPPPLFFVALEPEN